MPVILNNTGNLWQVNNFNLGRGMHRNIFRNENFLVVHVFGMSQTAITCSKPPVKTYLFDKLNVFKPDNKDITEAATGGVISQNLAMFTGNT